MYLTISSVLTTVFLCSILILFLCGLFKNNSFAAKVGPGCMIGLLLAVLIRMLVPFEFFYTYTIPVNKILTPIRRLLIYEICTEPFVIIVWHILIIIWLLGVIVLLAKEICMYRQLKRCVLLMESKSLDDICLEYQLNVREFECPTNTKFVFTDFVATPYLIGCKKCYIILPQIPFSKEQIKYILQHEIMHIKMKDIIWKIVVDILCTIVWWNPVFWFLKKELFQMIELRNDVKLTESMSEEEKIEYMECLKDMAVFATKKNVAFSVSFSKNNIRELKRRLLLVLNEKELKKGLQMFTTTAVVVLLLATSAVIIEPQNIIEDEKIIRMSSDNTYLIKNGETYDVYVDGVYLFNTDDLRPFEGVNIYNSIEEVVEND